MTAKTMLIFIGRVVRNKGLRVDVGSTWWSRDRGYILIRSSDWGGSLLIWPYGLLMVGPYRAPHGHHPIVGRVACVASSAA